ncbi:hypothetical protein A5791_17985 [Mycobacterium sp. 852002-51163_SCH5372311]|nr:hypothetical protein A5791_17985 [Mycobacterium sp. 852002-51163_SCH5372311]
MNLPLGLTKTHLWTRAAHDFTRVRRSIQTRIHREPPMDGDRVRPRHYPARSSSYLDEDLMNREMHDHVHEPTRMATRLAYRLRRS